MLHVCCGPCSAHAIRELKESYDLSLFFCNPNLYPKEEYTKRLDAVEQVATLLAVPLIIEPYEPEPWKKLAKGLEEEKEGGRRCELCYEFRLQKTAERAKPFGMFATTLTVSPHKSSSVINRIGRKVAKEQSVAFLELDLKKKDGFLKSTRLSKEMGLYRQDYCGCRYSLRNLS